MSEPCKTVDINGHKYVRADLASAAQDADGKPYVIVRTNSAGCFAGYLADQSADGKRVKLLQCRRLWHWEGAASLSGLAVRGTSKPAQCQFPDATPEHDVTEAIEVIRCTEAGRISIVGVPIWVV